MNFPFNINDFIAKCNQRENEIFLESVQSDSITNSELVKLFSEAVTYINNTIEGDPKIWYALELCQKIIRKLENAYQQEEEKCEVKKLIKKFQKVARAVQIPFEELPEEIVHSIFSLSNPQELIQWQLVSRQCRAIGKEIFDKSTCIQQKFQSLLIKHEPLEKLYVSNAPVELILYETDVSDHPLFQLDAETQKIPIASHFPRLSRLSIGADVLPEDVTVQVFLRNFSEIESISLILDKAIFENEDISTLPSLLGKQKKLETFELIFPDESEDGIAFDNAWLLSLLDSCPTLQNVGLCSINTVTSDCFDIEENDTKSQKIYPNIRHLRLKSTRLSSQELAHFLGAFPNIESFGLEHTQNLGKEVFQALSGKKNLRSLFLTSSNLHDALMEDLSKLSFLEEVNIDSCMISDRGFLFLSNLKHLKKLSAYRISVKENSVRKVLSQCQELEECDLSHSIKECEDSFDAIEMPLLEKLKILKVVGCAAASDLLLDIVKSSKNLKDLNVQDQKNTSQLLLHELKNCIHLRSLKISGIQIRDESFYQDLSQMYSLKSLSFDEVKSDVQCSEWKFPSKLEEVNFSLSTMTDVGLQMLVSQCPSLLKVSIENAEDLESQSFKILSECKGIKELSLLGTKIDEEAVSFLLSKLENVESLCLMDCTDISEKGIKLESIHKKLKSLYLGVSYMKLEALIQLFTMLPSLELVDYCHSEDGGESRKTLQEAFPHIQFEE